MIVASFYFWAAGFKMQTSKEGLYRTLLSQVFQSCPEAVPYALPERWEALCLYNKDPKPFDEIKLRNILDSVIKFASFTKSLCLFIDGLDEFNGTHGDLIEFVKNMIETLPVKVCVASRPWVVFEAALEGKPSLMIEDLTFNDIRRYVTSRFESDAEFVSLQNREVELSRNLIEDVVRKASGVFLWVSIVASSLLEGIKYGDRVSDLQQRLSQLPPDLESLYDRILHNLDPFYLEHAAQYFRIMATCEHPPEALLLSFADEEELDFAVKLPNAPLAPEEMAILVDTIRKRLNSRRKGFINVPKLDQRLSDIELYTVTAQYHHRTVKDYIEQPNIQAKLLGMMKNPFDPYLKLCSASLSIHKTVTHTKFTPPLLQCLRFASKIREENTGSMMKILDELENTTTTRHISLSWVSALRMRYSYERFGHTFISLAIKCQVIEYVKRKVRKPCLVQGHFTIETHDPPTIGKRSSWNPLRFLQRHRSITKSDAKLWPFLLDAIPPPSTDMGIVAALLENGADPNFVAKDESPSIWVWTLTFALNAYQNETDNLDTWMNVLRVLD